MQEKQEMQFRFLGQEDILEKEMATHSNILDWKIPWTEESGGPSSAVLGSSVVSNSVTPWTVACHVPLSMQFFSPEYWSG